MLLQIGNENNQGHKVEPHTNLQAKYTSAV